MRELRDVSVMFLRALKPRGAKLLDSTAATGIRGIRYALEAGIKDVTLLEISDKAARIAKRNAARNRVRAKVVNSSIREFAASCKEGFDVVDLDPFGSPTPYLYDLLRICVDRTLLMVTATDTATLCGAEGHACERIYGARPLHNELCHEAGIRILIAYIARTAAQMGFGIEPKLSISSMHYMRTFLALRKSAREAVESVRRIGLGTYCTRCHGFSLAKGMRADETCYNCSSRVQLFGPLWAAELHDKKVVEAMLHYEDAYPGASRLVREVRDEVETPFFYSIPKITSRVGISSVPMMKVLANLQKRNKASRTHFDKDGVKTEAKIKDVIEAVKAASRSRHLVEQA